MGVYRRIYAMLWLHVVRTSRYLWSLANWGVTEFMWIAIYILGALAFTPEERYGDVVPTIFWAVIAWNMMSTATWTIGNWIRFYINMGMFEEHELADASHALFLTLRTLPALVETIVAAVFVGVFLANVTSVEVLRASNPLLLGASLALILVMAILYSLSLAFLSMAAGSPAPLLDFLNFILFIVGGIAVPVSSLPGALRLVAILTPYSHPAELMRYASVGWTPYLGVHGEVLASLAYITFMGSMAWLIYRWARWRALREGVKGIGRT